VDYGAAMRKRLGFIVVVAGLITLVFAFELRTWHGRGTWAGDPKSKFLIASWLGSELWLNPWLLIAGLGALGTAGALLLRPRANSA
jgi:hypothetical protein